METIGSKKLHAGTPVFDTPMHRYEKHRETQLKVATRKWSQFRVAQEHASAVQMHIRQ